MPSTPRPPLPVYPNQRTSPDRRDWAERQMHGDALSNDSFSDFAESVELLVLPDTCAGSVTCTCRTCTGSSTCAPLLMSLCARCAPLLTSLSARCAPLLTPPLHAGDLSLSIGSYQYRRGPPRGRTQPPIPSVKGPFGERSFPT